MLSDGVGLGSAHFTSGTSALTAEVPWFTGFSELGVGEWDMEGFHLIVVERSDTGMVLEIESCDPVAGCPGCGVIAQGHGRVVVEVIDAPWAGAPVRIRWCEPPDAPGEHPRNGDLHRAEPGGARPAHAAGRPGDPRQLRFEGATIADLARQLCSTWNTLWSHIQPVLTAAVDGPSRFAGVRVLGVDEHGWHHQGRRRRGPRELTSIMEHDLGRGPSHDQVVDLVPGR